MKIGLYISPAHTVPPAEAHILAPWLLVRDIADGLVRLGHDVHLFAAAGSVTRATLHDAGIAPTIARQSSMTSDDYRALVIEKERQLFEEMMRVASVEGIEVLHIHQPVERLYPTIVKYPSGPPLLFTFHDPITPERLPRLEQLAATGRCFFVSISNAQRESAQLPFIDTVYNGIDTRAFIPDGPLTDGAMLLCVGRIVPEKGMDVAIQGAKQAGERLMIAGQVYDENPEAKAYFEKEIQPLIDGKQVFFEPVMKRDHLLGHYQMAKALLFPIQWEEPFGLVMVEAMACGTPVIAYNRGSVSEIVVDGVTGFVVNTTNTTNAKIKKRGIEGLVEAIKRIGEIDRAACRRHVEEKFSVEKMVKGYEKVYETVTHPTPLLG